VAAIVPVAIYALGMLVILRRAGYAVSLVSPTVARRGTWIFAVVMALSALVNLASDSGWERLLMAPVAAVLAVLSVAVARTGRM
jgi:hypothetical protein